MSKSKRKIILIDEEKCDGCGQCVTACAESALELINGKAKLVGEVFCDGLGACIGECPQDALKIVEREADDFDEAKVHELVAKKKAEVAHQEKPMACGCPGSSAMSLKGGHGHAKASAPVLSGQPQESQLGHWPIKLTLLAPFAPYLKNAELVLMADCAAAAYPDVHDKILKGRAVAMGCPKLDDVDAHIEKLAEILATAQPSSLTVLHMEVPCCHGFVHAAQQAIAKAGTGTPLKTIMIGRTGEVLRTELVKA